MSVANCAKVAFVRPAIQIPFVACPDVRHDAAPGALATSIVIAPGGLRGRDEASPGQGFSLARRVLYFLFGRGERHQASAPSPDEPSELYLTSVHESGHALAARLLGKAVLLATTVPNAKLGFGGRVITGEGDASRAMSRSLRDGFIVVDEIAAIVERHMPGPGEAKEDASPWLTVVHGAAVEWLAGAAAESIAFGRADDRRSRSDYLNAQRYARTICSSDVAAEAFLEFALIEAVELITPYRSVLLALAAELAEKRELDGDQIDRVITAAIAQRDRDQEAVRRADWNGVTQRAEGFEKDQRDLTEAGQ
jgi:hypothetical protein